MGYDAGHTQGFNDAIDEMQKAKVKEEWVCEVVVFQMKESPTSQIAQNKKSGESGKMIENEKPDEEKKSCIKCGIEKLKSELR